MTLNRIVKIDFTSDVICPWCLIGLRRLEKALESFKNQSIDFQIEFHPFELNGDLPKEGADKLTMYRKKFGNERVEKMVPFMKAAGLEYGVHFTYGGLMANTFDSHRLIAFAKTKGLQYQLKERLLQAYHEESQNIGDHQVLAENYGKVGGDVQEALNFLASDELSGPVREEINSARRKGISGVPNISIGGVEVEGAESPEVLVQAINKALKTTV